MNIEYLSPLALAVVLALFVAIYLVRRRGAGFTVTTIGAMAVGVAVGILFSGHTGWVEPIGKIYISILSCFVAPLIIVSILSSVTSLGSVSQLKGIGARSVFWLMVTTILGILLALGLALTFGLGKNSFLSIEGVDAGNYSNATMPVSKVVVDLFPQNVVGDIAGERIIPIILFAVLIAVSYVLVANRDGDKVAIFKRLVDALREIVFKAVGFVIDLTPYAVLALIASVVSGSVSGEGMMWSMLAFLALGFIGVAVDMWLINAVLLRVFAELPPLQFFRKAAAPQIVGFSTQSSMGTLPVTIKALTERVGVGERVANFTAPLGTTLGMPACAGMWPVLTAVFGANGLGIPLGVKEYVLLGVFSLLVSFGTAGVPGTATIASASVLTALGLPIELIVLTFPVAAILDTGRTAANLTGAMTAAAIVAREEGELDEDIFYGRKEYRGGGELSLGVSAGSAQGLPVESGGAQGGGEYEVPTGACKI
ncbi:MAG: dicarboxylate/amino acid:cation symporter [Clostridiales Family XIII bacterium]|jgi:Na+/H+-dicarboxylate symporter|nr:dicarboxylate/amino acid:cation symporter [Clostridiales Family XIII bacterium]